MDDRAARFPISIRKNNIWFSELVGIAFVMLLLSALTAITAVGINNEMRINRNHRAIIGLQERISVAEAQLSRLQSMDAIATMLSSLVDTAALSSATMAHLTELVWRNSRTYGYDPALLLAVIHVESVFKRTARGRYLSGAFSGALGLMQLKFSTAQEVAAELEIPLSSPEDLFIPEINIALGVAYLTQLIAKFKDLKLGILAYNQGPGTIMESLAGKRPLSISYYEKVLKTYYRLKRTSEARKAP